MIEAYSLWRHSAPLVLASKSASRLAILDAAGLPVEAIPAAIDERALEDGLRGQSGPDVAVALATAKALAVSKAYPGRWVLGADQTLRVNGQALHKPVDRPSAARQLATLAGTSHELHSAASIVLDGEVRARLVETARLKMRQLSDGMIERYLDAAGPAVLTSVGAYQLESVGIHLFEAIEGDHFTILGLPLLQVLNAFRQAGVVAQ